MPLSKTSPNIKTTKTVAIPRAAGMITAIENQVITVQFADIAANPQQLRNATYTFKVDTNARKFVNSGIGTWVVASWGTSLRRDAAGNILVQGSVGNGAFLRSFEYSAHREPQLLGWTRQVQQHLQDVENRKIKIEQGKQNPLPANRVLSLATGPSSGDLTAHPSQAWLGVPVPLPVMNQEWNFPDSYLRLGYVSFVLDSPVEDIQVGELSPNESISTLRSRTPIQKNNWHAQQQVTISFTCHGQDTQNQILLPLLRMMEKTPFIPVFNTLLFEYEITALTLSDIQIATIPGFPNSVKVILTGLSFNWQAYLPTAQEFSGLDWQICYPLMKLWVERPPRSSLNYHVPMGNRWDGRFSIMHADEDWLRTTNEFGQTGEKGQRSSHDKDIATTAINWRDANLSSDFTGFRVVPDVRGSNGPFLSMSTDVARVKSFSYGETVRTDFTILGAPNPFPVTLRNDNFGRVSSVTFLRPHSELAVFQLLDSPDLVKIYKGSVQLESVGGYNDSPVDSSSPDPKGRTTYIADDSSNQARNHPVQKDDLRQLIGQDLATREEISRGDYIFVINSDSSVFDSMSTWHQTPVTKDPRDQPPVADLLDAFAPPSMVVEQISCQRQNIIANLQPRGQRTPTHQYLGSNAAVFTVVGTLKSQLDIGHIEQFLQTVNRLGRQYKGRLDGSPFGGFVFVDNEFFQFLGVQTALVTNFSTQTVPDFPGAIKFTLELVQFDPTQRQKEVLEDLFKDFADLPVEIDSGVFTGDVADRRIFSQHDTFNVRYVRAQDFKDRLRKIELYPDLSLPTHQELAKWVIDIQNGNVWDFTTSQAMFPEYDFLNLENGGTGWNWGDIEAITDEAGNVIADKLPTEFLQLSPPPEKPQRFADPDFYMGRPTLAGSDFVETTVLESKGRDITLSDPYGAQAKVRAGRTLTENDLSADPQNSVSNSKDSVQKGDFPQPLGASPSPADRLLSNADTTDPNVISTPVGNAFAIPQAAGGDRPAPIQNVDDRKRPDRIAVYGQAASAAARRYNIPADLLFAHIEVESNWVAKATSRTGARGLGQIEPGTGVGLGVPNPADLYDPVTNIFATAKYISQLRSTFANRPNGERLAIAAYNSGPGAVKKHNYQVPPFPETQQYVLKVIQARAHYKTVGSTTPIGDNSAIQSQSLREARQLFEQFKRGYGYNIRDIFPFIQIGNKAGNSKQVFNSGWFKRVDNTPGGDFLIVRASQLSAFIEAKNKYKVFPPLVKISEALPGKNLYQHDGNSKGADFGSFVKGIPRLFPTVAGIAQGVGTLAGGGNVWDALHADAQKVNSDFTAGEFFKDVKAIVEFPLAIFGEPISQQAIADQQAAADKAAGPSFTPPTIDQIFHDPIKRDERTGAIIDGGRDIFHDMREEIQMDRLISAFPTFYVAIVDGGRSLRVWRLFDHVYGMMAVTRIAVHRTRQSPIETAVVGFSNMYGHLTAQSVDMDRVKSLDTRGIFNVEANFRGIVNTIRVAFDEETTTLWARQINSLMLKPGARLHIRLGYGADASLLPVVFNGVISEVPIQEGEVEVVALSDGVELTNDVAPTDMQGSMPVTRLTSLLGEGLNPRELVMSFLAPNDLFSSLSNAAGQQFGGRLGGLPYFNMRNAYGIEHFGAPFRLGIRFDDGEVGINVYDPEHGTPFTRTSAWDSCLRILQPWHWDGTRRLIGINMSNATPWDIFDAARRTVPEYMLYTHPFELRSTLFLGKGWFPVYYEYKDGIDASLLNFAGTQGREDYFEWKPFQQCHMITSDWNLIGNMVTADASQICTKVQAVGTYSGWNPLSHDMSLESSFVMMLDSDIYDEFQKMKIIESGLYTTFNMKLTEANSDEGGETRVGIGLVSLVAGILLVNPAAIIAGGASLLEGPFRSFFLSRRVMDYYAASALKDHVKNMYQGQLVCLGNSFFKPYDFIAIADHLSGLNGLAEIKECVHTMSLETGFVTTVTPDACVRYVVDTEGTDLITWAGITTSHLLISMSTAVMVGKLARRVSPYFALHGLKKLQSFFREAIRDGKDGMVLGQTAQKARDALDGVDTAIRKVIAASRIKDNLKVKDALEQLGLIPEIKLFEDKIPLFIKAELVTQQVLRGIPSLKGASTVADVVSAVGNSAKNLIFDLGNKVDTAKNAANTTLSQARNTLDSLGKSADEIKEAENLIRAGKASNVDQELVTAISGVRSAERALARANVAGSALSKVPAIEGAVKGAVKTALSENCISLVVTSVVNMAVGGLADYLVRAHVARQCLTVWPLRVYQKEFTAGINGHRGAVAGDDPGVFDNLIQNFTDFWKTTWVGSLIPIVGDLINDGVSYRNPNTIPPFFRS